MDFTHSKQSKDLLLNIDNLSVAVGDTVLLQDISLKIKKGEIHFLLGRNGAGKSTLAHTLVGKPGYKILSGNLSWEGEAFLEWTPEKRAHVGLLMAFQNPVVIPGVSNFQFLQTAINEKRKAMELAPLKLPACLSLIKQQAQKIGLDTSFLNRAVNEGFSGGEKKKNELLQLTLLEPKLLVLDEIDSGLDFTTRRWLGRMICELQREGVAFLVITHYTDLLEFVEPTAVHIMHKGKIIQSGNASLAKQALVQSDKGAEPSGQ